MNRSKQENSEDANSSKASSQLGLALVGIAAVFIVVGGIFAFLLLNGESPPITRATADTPVATITTAVLDQQPNALGSDFSDQSLPAQMIPQAGGRTAGDPYIPEIGNTGYDVQHYTIRLVLNPADNTVRGATTIEAIATVHGLVELSLDFAGFEVASITVDGVATNFIRESQKLIIAMPDMKGEGEPFFIEVIYHGTPLNEPSAFLHFVDHLGLHYPDGKTLFVIAEPDGAHYWFPANDHPRDKATFRFEIVVPSGLTAVANGEFLESEPAVMPDGGEAELFIWENDKPMAPYLAFTAVADYERLDDNSPAGVMLRHYFFPGVKQELLDATTEVGEALDWMSELFGPYPFEAFGYVTAHIPGASMETQSLVLLSSTMIGKHTAIHELAHMWFGDWVSLDSWEEMWRNEGFATYVQLMWETGDDPEELELRMATLEAVIEGNDKDYPLNHPPPQYLFDLNIYYKGALAVHALREEVGDEAFFTGLQEYFRRFGGRTASDADFRNVMEESAGRSLDSYYNEWFPENQG